MGIKFGEIARQARHDKGWTQQQMVKLAGLKFSPQYWCFIENGKEIPSLKTTIAIANLIGIPEELAIQWVVKERLERDLKRIEKNKK
jgi:transcriptional regulator with XRE-family HTH domain